MSHWIFKMSSCGSYAGLLKTSAQLINDAVFHSNSHISQMLPQIIFILTFCPVDWLPKIF